MGDRHRVVFNRTTTQNLPSVDVAVGDIVIDATVGVSVGVGGKVGVSDGIVLLLSDSSPRPERNTARKIPPMRVTSTMAPQNATVFQLLLHFDIDSVGPS